MKLELKHLAPYLPYGLQMIFEGKGGRVITLMGIADSTLGGTITNGRGAMWIDTCGFKPILRKLADITEDEAVNLNFYFPIPKGYKFENVKWHMGEVSFLFSKHFDVFNLIPEGLAIDTTTLKAAV